MQPDLGLDSGYWDGLYFVGPSIRINIIICNYVHGRRENVATQLYQFTGKGGTIKTRFPSYLFFFNLLQGIKYVENIEGSRQFAEAMSENKSFH